MSQKTHGQYYTDVNMATKLVRDGYRYVRAVGNWGCNVYEPCVGEGSLLGAALTEMEQFNRIATNQDVLFSDIDPKNVAYCEKKFPGRGLVCDVLLSDSVPKNVDWIITNPPFLGGMKISSVHGAAYKDRLVAKYGKGGTADLCSYFLRVLAEECLSDHGVLSMICTNTIAQGDTRQFGLKHLVDNGFVIVCADTNLKWTMQGSNKAAVVVSLVHLMRQEGWNEILKRSSSVTGEFILTTDLGKKGSLQA